MSQAYQRAVNDLDRALHQPGYLKDLGDKIEQMTGVKRIYVAQGCHFPESVISETSYQ